MSTNGFCRIKSPKWSNRGDWDHEGDGRPLSGGASEVRLSRAHDPARGSNGDDSVPDGPERRPDPQALHELFQVRRGAGPQAARPVTDADRTARADAAARSRVGGVRESLVRERRAVAGATAGAAAQRQRHARPALLRLLRVIRLPGASQLVVVRMVL